MKQILVPVDFSPVTHSVLDTVATIALACQSKVFLVHVAPALSPELRRIPVPQKHRDIVAHALRDEHRQLQDLAGELTKRGCEAHALLVEGHRAVEKILDEAQRLEADLIVMGSHGHGKLFDLLLGSTCEGVLRRAGIPMLIVPAVPTMADKAGHADAADPSS
jgi:nucleotide-binding universal stress UspA family protein